MEQACQELKMAFKFSFLLSFLRWQSRDKSRLPLEYLLRMDQMFLEAHNLSNEVEMTLEYGQRLLDFHPKMKRLENEFAHLN